LTEKKWDPGANRFAPGFCCFSGVFEGCFRKCGVPGVVFGGEVCGVLRGGCGDLKVISLRLEDAPEYPTLFFAAKCRVPFWELI
jgi:hypothetical protein